MTRLRRPPSSAWLRRGPLIVKVLFIICIIQIVFTVYVAVRVLKSSLEPDGFVFGGLPSALSERQRDLAEVLGSLDRLDFQQPVEFIPDNIENKGKPTMRRFIMRPLSIMDVVRHDQELNQLIVSDNKIKSKAPASNASFTGDSPPKSFSSKFPSLKMYKIRPVDAEDYETFSSKNDVLMKEMARDSPGIVAKSSAKKVDLLNLGSNKHSTKAGGKLFNSSPYNEAIHRIDSKHKLANFATLNSSLRSDNNIVSSQAFPSKSFNPNQASGAQTTLKTTGSKSDSRSQNIFLKYNHSLQTRAAEKLSMTKHSNTIAYPGRTRIINMPNLVSDQKLNLNAKSLYEDQDHQTHDDGNHTSQVLIYSLARSLGRYLWTHVIGGVLKEDSTVVGALVDNKTVDGITFVYREDMTGRAQLPSMGHHSVVLVASGETEASISVTREWLDHSADSRVATGKLLLVLRGSAECKNSWLEPYVDKGVVRAVLLTLDDSSVDNSQFYLWPLAGSLVATQQLSVSATPGARKRRYLCGLWAPQHQPSSGLSQLLTFVRPHVKRGACALSQEYEDKSSNNSLLRYVELLQSTDLVLCPAFCNAETSCIYDAIEAGGVPVVVVDAAGGGSCDTLALRLLKEMEAPFIWLDSWFGLQKVLDHEKTLNVEAKAERYHALHLWYTEFQRAMLHYLLEVVRRNLL